MLAVLKVPSGHEFEYESRLSRNRVKVYCPKVADWVRNKKSLSEADRFVCRHKPMLPGYLLIDEETLALPWVCFVKARYVMMNDKILMVPDSQLAGIRKLEEEMLSSSSVRHNKSGFVPSIGDMVKMTIGSLTGLCGRVVLVSGKMVKVSFESWPLDLLVPMTSVVLHKPN